MTHIKFKPKNYKMPVKAIDYFYGKTTEEVASILGITCGTTDEELQWIADFIDEKVLRHRIQLMGTIQICIAIRTLMQEKSGGDDE